jgi:hypothetical protein
VNPQKHIILLPTHTQLKGSSLLQYDAVVEGAVCHASSSWSRSLLGLLDPEDEGIMISNIQNYSHIDTALHSRSAATQHCTPEAQ